MVGLILYIKYNTILHNPIGRPFSISNTTGVAINNTGAGEKIILMIRGGNTSGNYYHQNIVPYAINLVDITNNNLLCYRIRLYADINWNEYY